MRQRKSRALWAPSAFGLPSWQPHQGTETEELRSRSHFQESWAVLRSKVTFATFSPSPLVPPGRDLNQGISQASCPEAAEHGYTQCLTMLPPAFGTLVCTGTVTHALRTCHHVIPKHPIEGSTRLSGSVYLSAVLPPQEALSHHRPASLQPGFLLHPARFTLLFPPPLPLPHGCQAMFAFLSPAVFPLPTPPRARSLLHPPREATS